MIKIKESLANDRDQFNMLLSLYRDNVITVEELRKAVLEEQTTDQ